MRLPDRPWGRMWLVVHFPRCWVKIIHVRKGKRTSLQFHEYRNEIHVGLSHWHWRYIPRFRAHRMTEGLYLELAWGRHVQERDITRLYDDYGRPPYEDHIPR